MFIKIGPLPQKYYKGIYEKAAFGLHDDIYRLASPFLKPGLKAIDLGCGEGAFSQRLVDNGLLVDSCDIDTDQIKAKGTKILNLDLNIPFKDNFTTKYDIVFCLEVMEHIKNPWSLIENTLSILNKDGLLVISTPNISNFISRLRFLTKGNFWGFEKQDLSYGHITPVSIHQLEYLISDMNLKIEKKGTAGPLPIIHLTGSLSVFNILRNTFLPLVYPFLSGTKRDRSIVYILRKV